ERVRGLVADVARELGAVNDPGPKIRGALDLLADLDVDTDWAGDLPDLPNGAKALKSERAEALREALAELRGALADKVAVRWREGLDALLLDYGRRFEALKRERGAVDFGDLELLAVDLLGRPEIGARYRERFSHVMVDELQDTNAVQLALVDLVRGPETALFMVGDAQQSIYGFRHADVELFEQRGRVLAESGSRLALTRNFRSRAEILSVLNAGYQELMPGYRPLAAGREDPPAEAPRVELLIADKQAEWAEDDGLATPWRAAEARALAARLAALVQEGSARPGEIVVLTRATTDLAVYERALEAAGLATFVVGGRGYWSHPQVVVLVSYLRALANPLDQEPLWAVYLSGLCGLSLDGLVLVADGARDELDEHDAAALARFEEFFAGERERADRLGAEQLIDRALAWSGYELELAALADGRRRLANVRKLMRLAREHEREHGPDLRGFVDFVEQRIHGGAGARDAEAPVESEALDAVRLMTIHRSKGLEFPVVCVADLGRGPSWGAPLLRLAPDKLGLRIGRLGGGKRLSALAFDELREAELEAERAEQRRLFYVALTRAQERLIMSGAMALDKPVRPDSMKPMDWLAPAFRELPGVAV
ncbi:MAG: UvrD-helicase domain-containing protein, partial [Solirubrobacterales bacterium]|nr:UvrD-helicase domain-containing protein [Solirubrobacterales bacterium]